MERLKRMTYQITTLDEWAGTLSTMAEKVGCHEVEHYVKTAIKAGLRPIVRTENGDRVFVAASC